MEEEKETRKGEETQALEKLKTTVQELSEHLEKWRNEHVELFKRPRKLIWMNFFLGLVRGIGTFIGFTVVAAVVVYIGTIILSKMVDLPLIGSWIAKIMEAVENARRSIGK